MKNMHDYLKIAKFYVRTPDSIPYYLPVNLQCLVQNTVQIFHIDWRKASDLDPTHIINAVNRLQKKLIVVCSDDVISREC